jgi:hypothetical protein
VKLPLELLAGLLARSDFVETSENPLQHQFNEIEQNENSATFNARGSATYQFLLLVLE